MKCEQIRISAVSLALILGCTAAQAADNFTGAVDGDWTKDANWATGVYPTNENVTLEMDAFIDSTVPNDIWAFRLGASGDAVLSVLPGADLTATSHSAWGSWLGMSSGYTGTVNQTGGSVTVNELEVGSQVGAFGYYNLSDGTVSVSGSLYERSIYVGATKNAYKNGAQGGTGTFSMTGGTLLTRGGVQVGHASLSGEGTFEVWGTGPAEIGIGSYSTNDYTGSWELYSNSTLRVGISADGITPIHINGGASTNATALFADGSILDVSFMDGYSEVGSWPIMVCEGTMVNAGLVFADSMGSTTDDWGFMVTNNTLMVGYGLGWPAGNPTTVVLPPSPARTLYWTGGGGDTSSSNAANWALDTAGTPSTWGIYQEDTIYIGHSAINETGEVYVVDYNGDAGFEAQNLLYIGTDRTGVLNMNSGKLTFTKSVTSRQQVGLGGVDGDGTINLNGGDLTLNTLRVGIAGSKGAINVNSGDLDIARSSETLDGLATSVSLGYSALGTGDFTISGGSLITRGAVLMSRSGGVSSFCVEGSGASTIQIGKDGNSVDGAWAQYFGSTLKILLDDDGMTPIVVRDSDNTHGNGGDVYFKAGSLLNVGWVEGAEKYGVFDVMTWDGALVEADLAFDPSVDTNVWDFMFVDTDDNGSNDTLRVVAPKGTTANGTPVWWLYGEGLTEADDETDTDGDGMLAWEEYVAGTSPTNAASVLMVDSVNVASNQFVVTWQSVEGKTYSVHAGDAVGSMSEAAAGITGLMNETAYTGTVSGADTQFYKVEVH